MKTTYFPSFLILFLILTLGSCSKDSKITSTEEYDELISNLSTNVIVATYADLANEGSILAAKLAELEANPTPENLTAARNAWIAARSPWEQSEGFLFGPVDQAGIDPSIDSWPVNVTDLNNVLNGPNALTPSFLAQQEGTLKGFHTIEFLLWGEFGTKEVNDFNAREFEYLAAASSTLASDLDHLYQLWSPSSGNFIAEVLNAGKGSQLYVSQKSVLEEFSNAIAIIADEVGNGKINDPLSQQDISLEESRFSNNSKRDFSNNIRSIQNIYLGSYNGLGTNKGLSTIIAVQNPSLDEQIKNEIQLAINAIENISGNFGAAIFSNVSQVEAAQSAVRDLQETLESELIPLISNL
ncbi:MAG: imelysin family protein [Chitinophagales bacterium]